MKNIAIYPGSFDPFTNGHLDIVKEASNIFDEVIIVMAVNIGKVKKFNGLDIRDAIKECLKREEIENAHVEICNGLTVDICRAFGAKYIVRGLRNQQDFLYEEELAKINSMLAPDINTIYFRASNEIISSSMVKELHGYGRDVSGFVPKEIYEVMVK